MRFTKHDHRKSRLDLLPARALEFVGHVLGVGARKYADDNWRKCKEPHRFVAASLRHEMKVLARQFIDPESNLPHLAHAITSLLFALDLYLAGVQDKLVVGNYFALIQRVSPTRGKILKRFKGPGAYERAWEHYVIAGYCECSVIISTVPSKAKPGTSYPMDPPKKFSCHCGRLKKKKLRK